MFRFIFVWISLASVRAARIQSLSEGEFGASCDNLQNRFHDQVHAFKEALDARTSESETTQARFTMRMYGVMRTLRRGRECAWVVENNSDDIEEMRSVVQELLSGNPCGEAARSELEAGASAEDSQVQMQAIPRAMSMLMSDDCEAPWRDASRDVPVDRDALEGDGMEQLQESEEQLQDAIGEIMDAGEEGEGAFIQVNQKGGPLGRFGRFMRGIGVFFLMLFLLLACVGAATVIVAFLVLTVEFLLVDLGLLSYGRHWAIPFHHALVAGAATSVLSLVGCTHQLYTNLLPDLVGSRFQ